MRRACEAAWRGAARSAVQVRCASELATGEVRGVVVSFMGRYPLVKLDSGASVTIKQADAPFVVAKQRLVLQQQQGLEEGADAVWTIARTEKTEASSGVFGDGSNALWNNKFAKQSRKK